MDMYRVSCKKIKKYLVAIDLLISIGYMYYFRIVLIVSVECPQKATRVKGKEKNLGLKENIYSNFLLMGCVKLSYMCHTKMLSCMCEFYYMLLIKLLLGLVAQIYLGCISTGTCIIFKPIIVVGTIV